MKYLISLVVLLSSQLVLSNTWYNDVGKNVTRIEQEQNGVVWLMRPTNISDTFSDQDCTYTQIKINPPSGREDSWLSMVLAASFAKKSINVFGVCDSNSTITATRLTIE